jgi:multidrug efflux pump subunit AcrA (membrane-fusion protein)
MSTRSKVAEPDLGSLRIDEHSRSGAKLGKWIGLSAACFGGLAIIGVLAFIFSKNYRPVVEAATVQSASVEQNGAVLHASGYVTPRIRATIAAKITGRITAVYVDEGMRVIQNQLLATLDDSDARVRLDSAKADCEATEAAIPDLRVRLANAERELTRANKLQSFGIETAQAVDVAQTAAASLRAQAELAEEQVKASRARIEIARQDLDNAAIRAPFGGMVVSKDAQVGEIISPVSAGGGFTRTGIATIVDMKSLEIEGRRKRILYCSSAARTANNRHSGCLSRLATSSARPYRDPHRRPAEGHCKGAHILRQIGLTHPAGHGGQGHLPERAENRCEFKRKRRRTENAHSAISCSSTEGRLQRVSGS